jgi:tRNA pseudouridine13 synthase
MPPSNGKTPAWQWYLGEPESSGQLRTTPEDFQVWELPLIEPQGTGAHLWLEIRKRGANTQWVAGQLAAAAGVPLRDIGFAGMKDRHAVTTQWFSVGLQEAARVDWTAWDIPDVAFLQARLHSRKLQRGALKGNRFLIVLRKLRGDPVDLEERLNTLAESGAPNYFGPQRFGRDGANVERAVRWLEAGGRIKRSQRSLYLSVARSYLFNLLLSERVRLGNWNRLVDGDLAMLAGSRSTFACSLPDTELERRCAEFDIHPTGPLPGRDSRRGNGGAAREAAVVEEAALGPHAALVESLQRAGVDADRRSLRVLPANLVWQLDHASLTLEFELPPGSYATSVLRELVLTDPATISEDT